MRYLGIDFGTKKIGLAITDPSATLVLPYETLAFSSRKDLAGKITRIVHEEGIGSLIVGLPLDLNGRETLTTRQARNFAADLVKRTGLPVYLVNEALTTFDARESLIDAGINPTVSKKVLDRMAAVRILESYLESPDKADPANP
ncbi:MAG: Holliday junction resolvase RuvX [Desulfovibrionales bacterium]